MSCTCLSMQTGELAQYGDLIARRVGSRCTHLSTLKYLHMVCEFHVT